METPEWITRIIKQLRACCGGQSSVMRMVTQSSPRPTTQQVVEELGHPVLHHSVSFAPSDDEDDTLEEEMAQAILQAAKKSMLPGIFDAIKEKMQSGRSFIQACGEIKQERTDLFVLNLDIVGSTKLLGVNQCETLAAEKELFSFIRDRLCGAGRIYPSSYLVNIMGDGVNIVGSDLLELIYFTISILQETFRINGHILKFRAGIAGSTEEYPIEIGISHYPFGHTADGMPIVNAMRLQDKGVPDQLCLEKRLMGQLLEQLGSAGFSLEEIFDINHGVTHIPGKHPSDSPYATVVIIKYLKLRQELMSNSSSTSLVSSHSTVSSSLLPAGPNHLTPPHTPLTSPESELLGAPRLRPSASAPLHQQG